MNTYFQDEYTSILHGDCIETMKEIRTGSVHCCVTSPPYFGLRDYGTGTWEGGDSNCEHSCGGQVEDNKAKGAIQTGVRPGCDASKCKKCGATRIDKQIGLEDSPDAFVAKLVDVFREVRRVLRDDGTVWLNLGDSYSGSGGAGNQFSDAGIAASGVEAPSTYADAKHKPPRKYTGLKPKDLIGIPWRVAFALQQDGWYLRQDIIWHKPNPMPESVTDRCTKAHEYIFLLSKSAKYYYDNEAIKEPCVCADEAKYAGTKSGLHSGESHVGSMKSTRRFASHNGSRFDTGKTAKHQLNRAQSGERIHGNLPGRSDGGKACNNPEQEKRNKRSVWSVGTKSYKEAHFATFPPDLILPCILAGCPKGGTVLDMFGGSGTTADVAREHGRLSILCELNAEYIELMKKRLQQGMLSL